MIQIDRALGTPIYLQITNSFIRNITAGLLTTGLRLPGSRKLASVLDVNRRTVITAYDELTAQGWIEIRPNSGAYISQKLPMLNAQPLTEKAHSGTFKEGNFDLSRDLSFLESVEMGKKAGIRYTFGTGYPDLRLAPLNELTSTYNGILKSGYGHKMLKYASDFRGDHRLREEIATYLLETRCIHTSPDHIMITRGSLNAFFNLFQVLLKTGDCVVTGNIGFKVANKIIKLAGGNLLSPAVDDKGIDVQAVAALCESYPVKAVFVMPHHHHPTTVTLSAERRLELLMLAAKYRFAIIEDDYDYDFHYARNPILPIASSDQTGNVIYVGSFSKTVAPGLRVGFVVAPENVINDLANLSRFIDCHGNTALERAIALLFQERVIRRHLKKALNIYHERRDYFCQLMQEQLGKYVTFDIPQGGLAAWVRFREDYPVGEVYRAARNKGLLISDTTFYNQQNCPVNAIRMGFASLNQNELDASVDLLKKALQEMNGQG